MQNQDFEYGFGPAMTLELEAAKPEEEKPAPAPPKKRGPQNKKAAAAKQAAKIAETEQVRYFWPLYSGDLNTKLYRYLNGWKELGYQMVRYLNAFEYQTAQPFEYYKWMLSSFLMYSGGSNTEQVWYSGGPKSFGLVPTIRKPKYG